MESPSGRYLYRASAVVAGGRMTRVDPVDDLDAPIESVAPVTLPIVGGRSEAKTRKMVLDCADADFCDAGRADKKIAKQVRVVTIGGSYALAESDREFDGKPRRARIRSMARSVRALGGVSIKRLDLNMELSHDDRRESFPSITFGETAITGLKLGRKELEVTLDLDLFNKHPTLEALEKASRKRTLSKQISQRLLLDRETKGIYRSKAGFAVGTLVQKIEGDLPEGAYIEENGYTIVWPGIFGKIILGEVLISDYSRRATLVRFERGSPARGHDCLAEGDIGGGTMP